MKPMTLAQGVSIGPETWASHIGEGEEANTIDGNNAADNQAKDPRAPIT